VAQPSKEELALLFLGGYTVSSMCRCSACKYDYWDSTMGCMRNWKDILYGNK